MTEQIKSQLWGLSLAACTAGGCVLYERLVMVHPFEVLQILNILIYVTALTFVFFTGRFDGKGVVEFFHTPSSWISSIAFVLIYAFCTFAWYSITKKQGVLVGATYEMKYVVMLAVAYVFIGDRPLTMNVLIGVALALTSVYFISKN